MELTLHKQVKININMQAFIDYLLRPYRPAHLRPYWNRLLQSGNRLYFELNAVINHFTACDLHDFDNPFEIMQTIMKNAYIYATEHDYSQTDIDMLKEIIDRI